MTFRSRIRPPAYLDFPAGFRGKIIRSDPKDIIFLEFMNVTPQKFVPRTLAPGQVLLRHVPRRIFFPTAFG